ncbi:MAG: isochorismate synthase [Actinomycetota bacterium]|nr:isochorismate synthase [Actinomycetota bacterium]
MKLLASRTRRLPGEVDDVLSRLGPDGFAWLRNGCGFVTAGVAARIPVGPGAGRFERATAELAGFFAAIDVDDAVDQPGTGPVAVGALPFSDSSPGELVVPAVVVGKAADGSAWITETEPATAPASPSLVSRVNGMSFSAKEHPDKEEWRANVRRVLDAIGAGHVRKVVLAREVVLEADEPFDRRALLQRLGRSHPTCFTYAAGGFVGASPELLVRRRGDEVESCPMAGTVARGSTPPEDDALVDALSHSAKDAEEHSLLVEAVLDALAPLCAESPEAAAAEVVRLPTVSHLATRVRGRLTAPAPSVLSLVGKLHPTPAVGGLPRPAALAAIATLEGFDRGLYAGPVGWVDAHGEGEWAVALRGAELDGSRARLVAGAGIVAGSDPDAEWAETEAKLQAMLSAVRA